jgi:hypothetical protein
VTWSGGQGLPGPRRRLASLAAATVPFALCVALLPPLDIEVSIGSALLSFAVVLLALGVLVYGLSWVAEGIPTPRLLVSGTVAAALSVPAAFAARPEMLTEGPGPLVLAALFVADVLRIIAAAAVGISLARQVSSMGVALLIAGVATTADLFSVFAGPTKALVESGSPALDFLLLVFPLLGAAYGFGLGVSDFVFLALFTALARHLALRPTLTLTATLAAVFLALTTGLLLARPLPALPFVSLAFLLANGDLLFARPRKHPPR